MPSNQTVGLLALGPAAPTVPLSAFHPCSTFLAPNYWLGGRFRVFDNSPRRTVIPTSVPVHKIHLQAERPLEPSPVYISHGMRGHRAGRGGATSGVTRVVVLVGFRINMPLPPHSCVTTRRGVIEAANAALQEYMSREHPVLAEKCVISDLMKEVWKEKVGK